ncbi:MAG: N-6 DNA methylase, partial [candidate division Zixibacteria bacterium]|nr:N-6 DNA methylase [candidate division Zixibacteria bacterium]
MTISQDLMPYKADFPGILDSYYEQMKEAVRLGKHHDHRRHLFMNFLEKGFNVEPEEITIEEKVKAANVRGYIDALYKYIIFEFKTDLDAEREIARVEIKKYFKSRPRPAEFLAVVSDGLIFEVYQYEHEDIALIKEFVLDAKDLLGAHRFFDDIILATKKVTPKSIDIATRFGLTSAVFNKIRVRLETLFEKVQKRSSVKVKYREWNSLLAKVYGEELGDAALFLKHTYLTLLSRLMVASALFPEGKRGKSEYKGVLTGSYFAKKNLPNLAEPDFFSWAIETSVENDFLGITAILDKALSIYRLDNIGEDALKEVYQELVDPKSRHALGEYYTPDWIADLALERIGYEGGSLLDPACGSGTFLLAAIRRLRSKGLKGNKLVKTVEQNVLGVDVHPLAVMMSKANMLLGLAQEIRELKSEIYLPVYMADTLLVYAQQKTNTIEIRVSDFEAFRIPLETSHQEISIDALVDQMTHICHKGLKSSDVAKAWRGLDRTVFKKTAENEKFFWKQNFRLLAKLVEQGRNSIWGFILKNAYRPAFIRKQKVDYIVGNPPWLAYRYIKDKTYKARVKELTFENELLDKKDFKL